MVCSGIEMGEYEGKSGKEASAVGRWQADKEAENNKHGPDGKRTDEGKKRKVMKRMSISNEKELQVALIIVRQGGNRRSISLPVVLFLLY